MRKLPGGPAKDSWRLEKCIWIIYSKSRPVLLLFLNQVYWTIT
jgi:hypothetical protein